MTFTHTHTKGLQLPRQWPHSGARKGRAARCTITIAADWNAATVGVLIRGGIYTLEFPQVQERLFKVTRGWAWRNMVGAQHLGG